MNLDKTAAYLGGKARLAEALGLEAPTISNWGVFGVVPKKYEATAKAAVRARRKELDALYKDIAG